MALAIKARNTTATTKGQVKELRRQGYIPISIQHRGEETLHLETETRYINEFIARHGEGALMDIEVENTPGKLRALVNGVQRHPVTHVVIQATFQKISAGDEVKTHVPIMITGEPESVKYGDRILQTLLDSVEVRCQPDALPDHITVDISAMATDARLHVSDLPKIKGVTYVTSADSLVLMLATPAKMEAADIALDAAKAESEAANAAA